MSCADCFKTVPHAGTPVGRSETIAGVDTYISEPTATTGQKKILLYFADVFSPFYINSQLIQDWFASKGYTVLGVDYFFGDRLEELKKQPDFNTGSWIAKVVPRARECAPRWVEAVRQRYGTSDVKYFAVGYCFGAPYVFTLANDPAFKLAAAAVAHPSRLYDGATKQLDAQVIEKCVAPIAFGCAETDMAFPTEARRQAEDILVKNEAQYYFQVFSGTTHGFGTRGDLSDDTQRFAKEECARGFLQWFDRFAA